MVCTWWSCLGILMNVTSFSHVGFRHVGFRHAAGRLSSEDGSRFATLKIDVWACDAFRACRAREATCRSWTWAVNIFALHTTAPHTANYKNLIWARPGNKASVWASGAVSACSARAASTAVHVWSQTVSVVNVSVPYSQTDTPTSMWSGHTYASGMQSMMQIHIPSIKWELYADWIP